MPPDKLNFGDEITPFLIKKLFGRRVEWAPPERCQLAGVGSIIEILQSESKANPIQVWGSGFIKSGSNNTHSNLSFHAVRGKESLRRIKEDDKLPLGDPALLLPLILNKPIPKQYSVGLVPHYVDFSNYYVAKFQKQHPDGLIIDPLWPLQKVINSIRSCEIVLSSSLHGLIVADAYGIPNQRVVFSQKIKGGDYKYDDYYSVFEGRKVSPKYTGNKILERDIINNTRDDYSQIPNGILSNIQKKLIDAFPL